MVLAFGNAVENPLMASQKDPSRKLGVINMISSNTQAGLGNNYMRQVDFNNTNADVTLVEINGMNGFPGAAVVKVVAVCKTNLASAGGCNISVGVDGGEEVFIPLTDCTTIASGEVWVDATSDKKVESYAQVAKLIVSGGKNIKLFIEDAKQVDSGSIHFFISASPLGESQVQPGV